MHPLLDSAAHPVVGHRGNSAHAPENTLESFRQAVALGVDALEFDVRLTADGHVVVHHDPTVDRTTDGHGAVAELSLDRLRALDAGARFTGADPVRYRGAGIRIPTLEEVLTLFPAMPLLIEIKIATASGAVRRMIEQAGARTRCIVASFHDEALDPFRGSGIPVGSSRRDMARLLVPALVGWRRRRVAFDVQCMPTESHGMPLPVAGYVRILRPAGVPVHVWTVDDAATARKLWKVGVRGIISNDPAVILAEREHLPR
jgi:glycerophosphoryl diester phosphodiesterase